MIRSKKFILKSCSSNFFLSIYIYLRCALFRALNSKKINKGKLYINYLNIIKKDLKIQNDWFSHNIPDLEFFFNNENLYKKDINALEIGSYEGNSSVFFLKYLKNLKLTCVDTFEGSDEIKDKSFDSVHKNFKINTSAFSNRIRIFKEKSEHFFKRDIKETYDLIYIDGSHHHDDVLKDANYSFKRLNKNGYIIFDDFLWGFYHNINDNPIGAIKLFLKSNFFKIKILSIGYQLIIKKIHN